MKNYWISLLFVFSFIFTPLHAQKTYQDGEWLKFRIHYGIFNASYATLTVEDTLIRGIPYHHVKGHGQSTGLLHAFFKVDDTYESYINKETGLPLIFIRDINEGSYKKNKRIYFDQNGHTATVKDLKHNTEEKFNIEEKVQDMISVFYSIRDQIDEKLKSPGDELVVNMFF